MIQISFKTFLKISPKWFNAIWRFEYKYRVLVALFCAFFLLYFFNKYPLKEESEYLGNILSNFFDFSSIFAGILITYLITQVFQIKQERLSNKNEIEDLSTKLTNFRRICHVLLNSYNIWDKSVKQYLDYKHSNLSYFDFHKNRLVESNKYPESCALVRKYFDDKHSPNEIVTKFYTALRCLVLNKLTQGLFLYERYDNYKINYPLDLIQLWYDSECASTFYLALDSEKDCTENLFNISRLHYELEVKPINEFLHEIDKQKYSNRKIDNNLLLELGDDFSSQYIPRLWFLVFQISQKIPFIVRVLFYGLILFVITGVIIPLFCLSVKLKAEQLGFLTYLSVFSVLMTLIVFILFFDLIINREVQTYKSNDIYNKFVQNIKYR